VHAASHRGTAFIEIYQDCNIFNHQAWFYASQKDSRQDTTVMLEHGKPMVFGKDNDKGIRLVNGKLEVFTFGDGLSAKDALVHDETNRGLAFLLVQMQHPHMPEPLGLIYRDSTATSYDATVEKQVSDAIAKRGPGDLRALMCESDTWTVR